MTEISADKVSRSIAFLAALGALILTLVYVINYQDHVSKNSLLLSPANSIELVRAAEKLYQWGIASSLVLSSLSFSYYRTLQDEPIFERATRLAGSIFLTSAFTLLLCLLISYLSDVSIEDRMDVHGNILPDTWGFSLIYIVGLFILHLISILQLMLAFIQLLRVSFVEGIYSFFVRKM